MPAVVVVPGVMASGLEHTCTELQGVKLLFPLLAIMNDVEMRQRPLVLGLKNVYLDGRNINAYLDNRGSLSAF